MRPVDCEACHQPQPKDWKPGQRCIHCGGAVRTETRCAACTHWTPAGKFCRACAAELVPDEWYGAARMLVAAGVDALSLAERVRALDPEQREAFSSRFAVQRAVVEQLVEEARFAESFLLTKGHADRLEDDLLPQLPWKPAALEALKERPKGPFDSPEQLEASRTRSPRHETRALALLAQVRRGDSRRELLQELRHHLSERDPLAVEALAACVRAQLVHEEVLLDRWSLEHAEQVLPRLREALGDRVEGAVVEATLLRLRHREWQAKANDAGLLPRLREGLSSADVGLRYACALLLGDADTLDALLDEPQVRTQALRALSGLEGPHLVRRLRAATDDATRVELMRRLGSPLDTAAFEAVTEVARQTSEDLRREALRTLMRTKWDEVEPSARAALDGWVGRQGLEVPVALDLLHWAASTGDSRRPWRTLAEVQPYAVAAARALTLAPRTRDTLHPHQLGDFFAVATEGRPLEVVLDWLGDEATRDEALRRIFSLQGYLASYSPEDTRGVTLLFTAWERLGDAGRERLAEPFAELFRREGGSGSREAVLRGFWERFLAHPSERAAIWQATRYSRRELGALREADPRATSLDGGDPATRFALYGPLDPLGAPELLRELCEARGDDPALTRLGPTVLAIADTLFERGEHRHAMWLVASWMSEAVNRFREAPEQPEWRATALGFAEQYRRVEAKRRSTTPKNPDDSLATFEDQVETELRIAREVVEREDDARERERQREAERAAREAEHAREAAERQREAEARAAEAKRLLDDARDALSVQRASVADTGGGDPLDTEVLVPEHPIKTLRDYVAFMRAMQRGADVMALFTQYGLTPAAWGACATAWGTVMTKRMDVAMRFAKLLS